MTTRCVIYFRVSTDAQEREGTSLETQADACRAYAEGHGWTIVEALSDTASGFALDRRAIPACGSWRRLAPSMSCWLTLWIA
jgi:DNA invertase Pin-like site-specific DNA recombinase